MDHVVGVNTELGPEEWKRDPATIAKRTATPDVGPTKNYRHKRVGWQKFLGFA